MGCKRTGEQVSVGRVRSEKREERGLEEWGGRAKQSGWISLVHWCSLGEFIYTWVEYPKFPEFNSTEMDRSSQEPYITR